jgi:hypothetical protein
MIRKSEVCLLTPKRAYTPPLQSPLKSASVRKLFWIKQESPLKRFVDRTVDAEEQYTVYEELVHVS